MIPKTEIYRCRFNKFHLQNGDVGCTDYTIGNVYMVGMAKITPIKIVKTKDRVIVTFEGGTQHEFGDLPENEYFYRPVEVKKE